MHVDLEFDDRRMRNGLGDRGVFGVKHLTKVKKLLNNTKGFVDLQGYCKICITVRQQLPMSKHVPKPTEGELEILQILWKQGPSTVKQVNEIMNEKKEVGYTTSLKMLQIMMEKGLCVREAEGKLHIYKAAIKEQQVKKNYLRDLIDHVFEGSPMEMVVQTLGNYKASPQEIAELKKLLKELENNQTT